MKRAHTHSHRFDLFRRTFDIAVLDHEHHDIDRADLCRIIRRRHHGQVQIALWALQVQAVFAHRRQVRTARDKGNVMAGLGSISEQSSPILGKRV